MTALPARIASALGSDRGRTLAIAAGIGVASLLAFALTAPSKIFSVHTPYNHYALLAEGWLAGRLDLGGEPPAYTELNDFALYRDKWFVSFPPAPALLLVPLVAITRSADRTPDGLVFLLVAAAAPSVLFCALEKLRDARASVRSRIENAVIAMLLPLATVFWFSAVQGTVWFAAHALGTLLVAAAVWASVRADRPVLAGTFLAFAFATRPPLILAGAFFAAELISLVRGRSLPLPAAARRLALFVTPIAIGLLILAVYNRARFDDALEFGHRHLMVVWRPRMDKWGLFSLHYLGKNLGVALASTPFLGGVAAPFSITGHGLALWITSPFLALALWPRALSKPARSTFRGLAITAALVALPSLLYHNTGWVQFGYRFSNDYVVLLLCMLAVGRRKLGPSFGVLAAWSFAVNLFGAVSFQRPGYERFYRYDVRSTVYFEPD